MLLLSFSLPVSRVQHIFVEFTAEVTAGARLVQWYGVV